MQFHIWINGAQDYDATIDVPIAVLRQSPNPVIQSYLDWVEETGLRGSHVGEGATAAFAKAAYARGLTTGI